MVAFILNFVTILAAIVGLMSAYSWAHWAKRIDDNGKPDRENGLMLTAAAVTCVCVAWVGAYLFTSWGSP